MKDSILITGATRGIGLAISRRLAERKVDVIGIARKASSDFPGNLYIADLSSKDQTADCLNEIISSHTVLGVVNNVGIAVGQSLRELEIEQFMMVFDLNARIAAQVSKAVLPQMMKSQYGRIVNISSVVALGAVDRTSYATAKGAMISMTRAWALELAKNGITVNAIAPGPTETEFFRSLNPPGSPGEQRYLAQLPIGRLGRPNEIAAAAEFLLCEDAGFITGQVLYVDGGLSVGRTPL